MLQRLTRSVPEATVVLRLLGRVVPSLAPDYLFASAASVSNQ